MRQAWIPVKGSRDAIRWVVAMLLAVFMALGLVPRPILDAQQPSAVASLQLTQVSREEVPSVAAIATTISSVYSAILASFVPTGADLFMPDYVASPCGIRVGILGARAPPTFG